MGQIILNKHAMIDAAQTDIAMATVPDLLDRTAATTDVSAEGHAQRQSAPTISIPSLPQSLAHGNGQGSGHVGGSSNTCLRGGNGENDEPDVVIAELAHLSVHPLRRSIYSLVGCVEAYHQSQACQKRCIDDATFEVVAGWLYHVHGPANDTPNMFSLPAADRQGPPFSPLPAPESETASALLYNTFAASRHLLEILRYLQDNVGVSGTSTFSKSMLSNSPSLTSASSSDG